MLKFNINKDRIITILFILFFITSMLGSGFLMNALINSNTGQTGSTGDYIIKLNNIQYIISITSLSIYIFLHLPVLYFFLF